MAGRFVPDLFRGRDLPSPRIASSEAALEAICEIALTAGEPGALEALAGRTVDVVRDLLRADASTLLLWDERAGRLTLIAANDRSWDARAPQTLLPGEGVTGAAFRSGRPIIVRDYPASRHAVPMAVARGVRSGVAVPLKVGRRRVGVLSAHSYRRRPWTEWHARLLGLIASVVAPGLEAAAVEARASLMHLTPRETEVLGDLTAGKTARSIARDSGLAEATVRAHIRSVLAKFGVSSQLAAVVLARDLGLAAGLPSGELSW